MMKMLITILILSQTLLAQEAKIPDEFTMHGHWGYRIVKIDKGKRSLLVNLNDPLEAAGLLEVKYRSY